MTAPAQLKVDSRWDNYKAWWRLFFSSPDQWDKLPESMQRSVGKFAGRHVLLLLAALLIAGGIVIGSILW